MTTARKRPRKPPMVEQHREGAFTALTWRFPPRAYQSPEDPEGPAICSRCHAYLETDHWRYGERRYLELKELPDVHEMLCPGCTRVEKRMYEGEIVLRHDWSAVAKDEVLRRIHNEEAQARVNNPTARVARIVDRGDELYLLTTTRFLARRIGLELKKAYKGELVLQPLPRERFIRVRWER